ncbi:hypothetical protein CWE08_00025 [Aliidiomarina iranensis]|uniref:Translesion DNA synthesis-associated protein ImuA n=1 Tax=Aliidiomarina iranensis TaxID=1434071 RepID=A0A432W1K4_9GAMM|nr:hypothetical protein [Aliidiomarina iranensis]RUO23078.1 hypothetical protein CWE08_00025 [Aliidiomarina iranensis]
MQANLQQLMDKGALWKGGAWKNSEPNGERNAFGEGSAADFVSTGQPLLDQALGGGWRARRVHELQCEYVFGGELSLLAPAIAEAAKAARPVFWLSPPAIPYAPGIAGMLQQAKVASSQQAQHIVLTPANEADALWAAETILHSGQVGVLLLWADSLSATAVRRLHLAAAETDAWVFVLTGIQNEEARSYATRLRILLLPDKAHAITAHAPRGQVQWQLLKRHGGWPIRLPRQPLPRWPSERA